MQSVSADVSNGIVGSKRIQLAAWSVLLGAFAIFLALAIGVPWAALRYRRTATVSETAFAEPKAGSVAIESSAGSRVLREGEEAQKVFEGTTIATDSAARGFVRFFDGSTVSLGSDARITLERMRRPRFAFGEGPRRIELRFDSPSDESRLLVGTTWGDVEFSIRVSELGSVRLAPESRVRIDIVPSGTKVHVQVGEATVHSAGQEVVVARDHWTQVRPGEAPSTPYAGPENIVTNGDFRQPPSEETGWLFERSTPLSSQGSNPGRSRHEVTPDGRSVITFERLGSEGEPADMYYRQFLGEVDVASSSFIGVSATLKISEQSVPGGGIARSEFPVLLKLIFEAESQEWPWEVGFYVVPPELTDPDDTLLTARHVRVPRDTWYTFDSGNLLDDANPYGFAQQLEPRLPRPVQLRRIEIVASGHDYVSRVDDVAVWVK